MSKKPSLNPSSRITLHGINNKSVHFTQKGVDDHKPNTILGLNEKLSNGTNELTQDGSVLAKSSPHRSLKQEQNKALERLRRSSAPIFSGGLPIERIADLN